MLEYDHAPFGVIGLETALGVCLQVLYHSGKVPLNRVIEMLTIGAAKVFSIPRGTLKKGAIADVTIFDPNQRWTVDPAQFKSKSRNTPYSGWKLQGAVVATFIAGRKVHTRE